MTQAKTTSLAWVETILDILKDGFLTMTRLDELVEPEALMTALGQADKIVVGCRCAILPPKHPAMDRKGETRDHQ